MSHRLTTSRTTLLQTFRPNRRGHRVNRSRHRSRRRCSRLHMGRNHPPVRPHLPSNLGLSRLRSLVILWVRGNSRSFNSSSRFNHSLVNSSYHTNNPLRRCNSNNSNNRRRERIRSQIWLGYSNLVICSVSGAFPPFFPLNGSSYVVRIRKHRN